MKKRFLFVIFTLFLLLSTVSFAAVTSGTAPAISQNWIYVGIIVLLIATVCVAIYVVHTYLKRK